MIKIFKKMAMGLPIILLVITLGMVGCNDHKTNTTDSSVTNPVPTPVQPYGSIHGTVLDTSGQPIAGLVATMLYQAVDPSTNQPSGDAAVTHTAVTGSDGQFVFSNVPVQGNSSGNADYNGNPEYTITLTNPSDTTTLSPAGPYAARTVFAYLSYQSLQANNQIAFSGNQYDQLVTGLTGDANSGKPILMRRSNMALTGKVVDATDNSPIAGATVQINTWQNGRDLVPSADFSLEAAIPATTDSNGNFTISNVPESATYDVIIHATGFQTVDDGDITVKVPTDPTDLTIQVTSEGYSNVQLIPVTAATDTAPPYVVSTNIPHTGTIIPTAMLVGDLNNTSDTASAFSVTWDEAMDTLAGEVYITINGHEAKMPVEWDSTTVMRILHPTIPAGADVEIELQGFRDLAGNIYQGENFATGNFDNVLVFGHYQMGHWPQWDRTIHVYLTGQGNTDLAQVSGVTHEVEGATATTPVIGGPAMDPNVSNNQNFININGNTENWTQNTINLSWTPDPNVPVNSYNIYAEFDTGGFTNGVPIFIKNATSLNVYPSNTTTSINLTDIDNKISGGLLLITDLNSYDLGAPTQWGGNGTDNFFNNNFTYAPDSTGTIIPLLNVSVTGVNSAGIEGPFATSIPIADNVPPVVANQPDYYTTGLTMDNDSSTFLNNFYQWAYSNTPTCFGIDTTTNSPLLTLSPTAEVLKNLPFDNAPAFASLNTALTMQHDATNNTTNSTAYDAADWSTLAGTPLTLEVMMNEDLQTSPAQVPAVTLNGTAVSGAIVPTTGVDKHPRYIDVPVTDLSSLVTGDTYSFAGVLDEAGNAAPSDYTSNLVIQNDLGAYITSAVLTKNSTTNLDTLTITFSEPVAYTTSTDGDSATNPDNYTFNGTTTLGSIFTAASGFTVTPADSTTASSTSTVVFVTKAASPNALATALTAAEEDITVANVKDADGNACANVTGTAFIMDNEIGNFITGVSVTADTAGADGWNDGIAIGDTFHVTLAFLRPIKTDTTNLNFNNFSIYTGEGLSNHTPTDTYSNLAFVVNSTTSITLTFDGTAGAGDGVVGYDLGTTPTTYVDDEIKVQGIVDDTSGDTIPTTLIYSNTATHYLAE